MKDKSGKELAGKLNIIFIDLITIRKKLGTPVEKLTPIEKWGLFFSYVDNKEKSDYVSNLVKSEEGLMAADKIIRHMSKADSNWFTQNSIYKAECDRNTIIYNAKKQGLEEGRKEGLQQGLQQKAIEAAVMMIKKYKASPESAAKDMNAPLELVLEALKKQ